MGLHVTAREDMVLPQAVAQSQSQEPLASCMHGILGGTTTQQLWPHLSGAHGLQCKLSVGDVT